MSTKAQDALRDRKWGIFSHYLNMVQNNPAAINNQGVGETSWDDCVNSFDTDKLAATLHKMGAGYYGITLMQGTQYLLAPNDTYTKISGLPFGEGCSTRDLVADLYDSLSKYDIDLYLYFTGDGPLRSTIPSVIESFDAKTPVTSSFVEKWTAVLREYSLRYGTKVKGWWLDGMYDGIGYNQDIPDADSKMKRFYDAAKAGNPDALVSMNYYGCLKNGKMQQVEGIGDVIIEDFYHEILPGTRFCDYTAGEVVSFDAYPTQQMIGNAQAHVFSFLGIPTHPIMVYDGWAKAGSKYSGEYMRRYVKEVNLLGGVVTIDVCTGRDGTIDAAQLAVLAAINE